MFLNANPLDRRWPPNRGLVSFFLAPPGNGGPPRDVASRYNADAASADDAPGRVGGPYGFGAFDFNGTDQSGTVAYSAALASAGVSTWSCWVRPRTFPGVGQDYVANLWSNETDATPSLRWGIGKGSTSGDNKRVGINFVDSGPADNEAVSGTDLAADVWTWVGVTADLSDVTFYYNGLLESTAAFAAVPRASTDAFRLGAAALAGGGSAERRYDGAIADLRYHPAVCLDAATMFQAFHDSRRRHVRALRRAGAVEVGEPVAPPTPVSVTYANESGARGKPRTRIDGRDDLLAQRIYKR